MSKQQPHISTWTDDDLVNAYRTSGDPDCVGELFRRYTDLVFLVSMKYLKDSTEAEDMTMKVFEKLLVDLKKYEVRSFRYWLHTVVKNQCFAELEKQKKKWEKQESYQLDQQGFMENGQVHPLLGEDDEEELQLQHLEQALGYLQEHQRLCVELFYLQKKSYQEVSDITGFDMNKVKSFIQNGKRNLKNHIITLSEEASRDS